MLTYTTTELQKEHDTLHTIILFIPCSTTLDQALTMRANQIAKVREVFGTLYGLDHIVKTTKKGTTITFSGYVF